MTEWNERLAVITGGASRIGLGMGDRLWQTFSHRRGARIRRPGFKLVEKVAVPGHELPLAEPALPPAV